MIPSFRIPSTLLPVGDVPRTCYNGWVMSPNDQVDALQAKLEEQFLQILSQPDVVIPADEIEGEFTEEQRATLESVLKAEMPSPEEIQKQIEMAKHNAEVKAKREERLARRKARQGHKRKRG